MERIAASITPPLSNGFTQSPSETVLPKTLLAFIWHFVKPYRRWFVVIQILALAWAMDTTLWPLLIGKVVDKISHYGIDKTQMWHDFAPILVMWAGLWIAIEVMFRVEGFMIAHIYPKVQANIRMSMFDYVQGHSFNYFSNEMAGTLSNRIADMPQSVHRVLYSMQTLFIPAVITLFLAVILFSTINFYFALLIAIWIIIHIGFSLYTAPKCAALSNRHSDCRSDLTGRIVDVFSNIMNVKLFARHRFEYQRVGRTQYKEYTRNQTSLRYVEKIKIGLGIITLIFPGAILTFSMFYAWQHNAISLGQFVLIFNASWNIIMVAWFCGLSLPDLFREIGICQQAMKVIRSEHEITDRANAAALKVTRGEIVFKNINFSYRAKQIVFKNFNVVIPAGQKIGLVGLSGSGKTTFVNLVLRFFDLTDGAIYIDNQDIRAVTRDSLRQAIAMIPQDPTLFHRSLLENIRYGRPDASFEEVVEAANRAHCHEFIIQLEQGYDTPVGERGIKLSGGQRQRIAIARAILKNAPILVLDEATSALDSVTEYDIQESLHEFMAGRTTIAIAHRLSTLADMDRILVFDQGRIVEDGDHESLLAHKGYFTQLWDMQVGGFLPD